MNGLKFDDQRPLPPAVPNRMDIACFIGFVRVRQPLVVPDPNQRYRYPIPRWLDEHGWTAGPYARPEAASLLDVPIPIDSWEIFDQLFAWDERRPADEGDQGITYLGAAVRSFFVQGGHKAYVVRVGDPWPLTAPREQRVEQIKTLIPGYPNQVEVSPVDPHSWKGVGHICGLPDVSFLCLPDLGDAVGTEPPPLPSPPAAPIPPEQFVECSSPVPPPPADITLLNTPPPRCDQGGIEDWIMGVNAVTKMLATLGSGTYTTKEVQFVASVPIPQADALGSLDLAAYLLGTKGPLQVKAKDANLGLASAFLQLVYPWVKTNNSADLPGGLESPDGVLIGLLAQHALTRGTFRSAANLPLNGVQDFFPQLPRDQIDKLNARISILGNTPEGFQLLSDVTTSADPNYSPASVNRLVSAITRAARRIGEDSVFESSGETLWSTVQARLSELLSELFAEGAFRGASPAEAFNARCDRSTMTQNDIDEGRLVASVQFNAAAPIETIYLSLVVGNEMQTAMTAGAA